MTNDFCGAWALAGSHKRAVEDALRAGLFGGGRVPSVGAYAAGGGVYVIEVGGILTKRGSVLFDTPGTSAIRAAVTKAAADKSIKRVVLRIDSPGGAVSGIDELAQAVASAAAKKPVIAFIEDLGASAAYWVASQATQVVMNRAGRVGSIGAYAVIEDATGAAEQQGVVVHVIRSSALKGQGVYGAPVSDAYLKQWQGAVDHVHRLFTDAVRKARPGVSAKAFTGATFDAETARKLGLIDDVATWQGVLTGKADSMAAAMSATERAHRWIDARVAVTGATRIEATAALAEDEPELHMAWLEEANR